ncbi:metal transporter Nramp1-like [Olea europaea var. sylvestris]|uniref:metal transporter Nramp1-like n=1 Tax=Olea europaea var. sylvestris TaxID=158386 RepID=UPI000C1CFE81|nr:metal transporter Nramp1-like [Olea europaea var. sylvestris]
MALVQIQETPHWKKVLSYIGPGFLVSVAYLDPGNLETDLQAGADYKYELLWIVLVGLGFALVIQSRSANLGVATGKHLSQHCRTEYHTPINYCLWILAEIAVIAADIPKVIGTAFALNILFNVPIWSGVLLAGLNTLLLLGLQRYGIRKLEIAIGILVLVVGGCFCSVMVHANPNVKEIARGMFIPKLSNASATRDSIALLGALIMPHNLFLHSALVTSRKIHRSVDGIRSANRYFLLESGLALLIAFLINVAVISVSGTVCSNPNISSNNKYHCTNVTLNSAALLLKNALGNWSSKLYAISLLASGQSSTVTGTYAGQYIMQGFLDLKMKLWLRNLVTRCIAIAPSLIACIIGGPSAAARLIIIASVNSKFCYSKQENMPKNRPNSFLFFPFELPFALVPLLKFTSSEAKMGEHKNSIMTFSSNLYKELLANLQSLGGSRIMVSLILWFLGACSIGINIYFLGSTLLGWITSDHTPKATAIITCVAISPVIILYILMLLYLTFKPQIPNTDSPDSGMSPDESLESEITRERDSNGIQRAVEIEM